MSDKNHNSINPETGTVTYEGPSILAKGNHNGMPQRTEAYLSTDERGHVQASSLSGKNTSDNIVPQAKDLNHGSYNQMEQGERDALHEGHSIQSEKIAYASNQPGNRPDAFMVNDRVTYANGQTQEIHFSFANMMNNEQESLNNEVASQSNLSDDPNPGDALRDLSTSAEYASLMAKPMLNCQI